SDLLSPMHGTVIGVKKVKGDAVQAGELILVIEAMKMENDVTAHRSGTLTEVRARVGDTVETDQLLAKIE
ncbi:MAG TPA: acetyl-CoA carboxylase biotin carboxyl carrier protein subunit, partial [Chloroflexota bacterium]